MAISISPELEERLRERAHVAGVSVETYIDRIAREDQAAEDELVRLALEGVTSGPPVVANEEFWAERRRRLIERSGTLSNP